MSVQAHATSLRPTPLFPRVRGVPGVGLLLDALPEAVVTTDVEQRVTGWNTAAERLFGRPRAAMIGASVLDLMGHRLVPGSEGEVKATLDRGETWTGGATAKNRDGDRIEVRFTASAIGNPLDPDGYVVVAHDITAQVRAERSAEVAEAKFADFMAAAPTIAFIKDQHGRYVYVNEHATSLTGDPVRLGWQGKTDYDLWPRSVAARIRENDALVLAGTVPLESTQVAEFDDGRHTLLIRKFPLRAATGEGLLGGIALDITDRVRAAAAQDDERDRESRSSQVQVQRAIVAEAMSRMRTSGTVETIATSIARLVLKLPGLDFAGVMLFEADGAATPIGLALSTGSVPERRSFSPERSRSIRRKLRIGPWTGEWAPLPDDPLSDAIASVDVAVMAYAPLRSGRDLLGFFVVGAGGPAPEATASELLPGLVEFAGLAGALLAPSVAVRRRHRRIRSAIRQIVQRTEFHPVFQPIVDLETRATIGYEATTRFDDETAPDVKFSEAASVGLGPELELATLEAVLRDATGLPSGHSLNINASPALVLAGDRMERLLEGVQRTVVCEITEHVAIEDYPALRSALQRLPGVQVAVDDAGAGFASFRHVLELRPSFVKLDRSLVAGIDGDLVRQALIAGMRHFAFAAGCRLVAEGIETDAELATLRELKVPLGQGYLLGRAQLVGNGP